MPHFFKKPLFNRKKDWKNLKRIGKVENIWEIGEKKSKDIRYYILDEDCSAQEMSEVVCGIGKSKTVCIGYWMYILRRISVK